MFKGLIETKKQRIDKKQIALFPIVIIIQAIMLGSFIISSAWSISYIDEPPLVVALVSEPILPLPEGIKKISKDKGIKSNKTEDYNKVPTTISDYAPSGWHPIINIAEGVEGGLETTTDNIGIEGIIPGGTPENAEKEKMINGPVRIGINAKGEMPKIISRIQPEYPEIARKARIEGIVILEAVIEKDGNVGEIQILKSLSPLLDQAAIRAVKQWKFEPAKINGKPVRAYFVLTIIFKIQ